MGFEEGQSQTSLDACIWAWLAESSPPYPHVDGLRYKARDFTLCARLYRIYLRAVDSGTHEERITAYGNWLRQVRFPPIGQRYGSHI